jgi:HSP20 family molecular chaperone IbpA
VQQQQAGEATRARLAFLPPTDIYETEESVVLLVDMPGIAPEDVDITLERRMLTIRGRAPIAEHKNYSRVYAEYEEGDYERVFTLSEEIDQDRIKAAHRDGVLSLTLPKSEQARTRKIEVQA